MREYILAMRAIWACWNDDEPLRFRGEFYRHTLMTPFFNPGPNPYGAPKVLLAAVGTLMTEVAADASASVVFAPAFVFSASAMILRMALSSSA